MIKFKTILLIVLSIWTCTSFGQTKYILTPEGTIVDTATYSIMKAELFQKMKSIFSANEIKLTIKDNFKEVRRTPDSLIYSYKWDVKIGYPKLKDKTSFNPDDYFDKEFPLPSMTSLGNKRINIDSLKGKPTLINFWFTTCKPCIEEIPVLNKIKSQLKDSANFIAITFESIEKTRTFLNRHKFSFTQIANAKNFTESMNMSAFPVNIFLDKNGIVRKIESGIPYIIDGEKKMKMGDGKEFIETLRLLL